MECEATTREEYWLSAGSLRLIIKWTYEKKWYKDDPVIQWKERERGGEGKREREEKNGVRKKEKERKILNDIHVHVHTRIMCICLVGNSSMTNGLEKVDTINLIATPNSKVKSNI